MNVAMDGIYTSFRIHVIMFVASMNTYIALLEYIDTCTWGVDVTRDGLHVIHCDD